MTIIERLQKSGIRRIGTAKRGFSYRPADGRKVSAAERARIEALKVPPAWTKVTVHPTSRASVQAIGMDGAGRWQYLYHRAHVARRERHKRDRLVRFIGALPRMRQTAARDLARPGLEKEKVLAGILKILATCFLRPGSEDYAAENGTYGLATLQRRHVSVRGDVIRFDFKGKSSQRQQRELRDRRVARLLRELLKHPGEVFKYRAEDGLIVDIRRAHINAYIKDVMGEAFSAKDFRTWAANLLCASALAHGAPDLTATRADHRRHVAGAIRHVAEHLGNTPAVCRASYVFPLLIEAYEKGRVVREPLDRIDPLANGSVRRIEAVERALLKLLRSEEAA